ncbi:hypothetical protein [Marinomonas sp. THO17]|uniref:hypothetical protein n=1 Tax=Marinomonas sp. THO17 TaxID=3149048 RepID=UPI00336BC750
MSNRVIFRLAVIGLLIAELAIGVALYFLDSGALDAAWEQLPESIDWYTYLESNFVTSVALLILLLVAILGSLVGVLLFKNWGRWLYLGSTVLIFPVSIFTGPTIYYGWENAVWDITSMVNGALILSMFLPPISNEFNKVS